MCRSGSRFRRGRLGSARCAADPGDDCNDDAAAVHPDATESCDGIDNDCDDLVDTLDGLALAGTTSEPIAELESLDLAWSPESEAFAMVFNKKPQDSIVFATLLTNGVRVGGTSPLIPPLESVNYFWPHIVWGGGETFGISLNMYDANGLSVLMTNVSIDGTASSERPTIAGAGNDIALRSDGQFVVTNVESGRLYVSHFSTGARVTGPQVAGQVSFPHIATQGNEAAIVWHDSVAEQVLFRRVDANLAPLGSEAAVLQNGGAFAEITATVDGYALAWIRDGGLLGFSRVRADGTSICSMNDLDLGITPDATERVALAETRYGTLALFTHGSGKVALYRFGADCALSAQLAVSDASSSGAPVSAAPAIAVGGGKAAIGWIAPGSNGHTRVFGERLCE